MMNKKIRMVDLIRLVRAADFVYLDSLRYEIVYRQWEVTDGEAMELAREGADNRWIRWQELKSSKQVSETEMEWIHGTRLEFLQLRPMQINSRRT
jgi:hypothetical protein